MSLAQVRSLIHKQHASLGKDHTRFPRDVFHAARSIFALYKEGKADPILYEANKAKLDDRIIDAARHLNTLIKFAETDPARFKNQVNGYKRLFRQIAATLGLTVKELEAEATKH